MSEWTYDEANNAWVWDEPNGSGVSVWVCKFDGMWHCGARLALGGVYQTEAEAKAHGESIGRILAGVSERWLAHNVEPLKVES